MQLDCTSCQFYHTDRADYDCSVLRKKRNGKPCQIHPVSQAWRGRELPQTPPPELLNHRMTLD